MIEIILGIAIIVLIIVVVRQSKTIKKLKSDVEDLNYWIIDFNEDKKNIYKIISKINKENKKND